MNNNHKYIFPQIWWIFFIHRLAECHIKLVRLFEHIVPEFQSAHWVVVVALYSPDMVIYKCWSFGWQALVETSKLLNTILVPVAGLETSELLNTFVFSLLFVASVWLFSVLFQVWSSGYWLINDCKGNLCCFHPIPNVKSAAVFLPPVDVRCYQKI